MGYKEFWDKRATGKTRYKGEEFYTITPLPYYVKRRELLLEMILPSIMRADNVLDFGCGDGWYINYFNRVRKTIDKHTVSGFDISSEMVKTARSMNPGSEVFQSIDEISPCQKFDLIYAFAVLAHIPNGILTDVLENLYNLLNPGGSIILFEQVGAFEYGNSQFTRRKTDTYLRLIEDRGFEKQEALIFSFSSHRIFERHIAKLYYKMLGGNNTEKRLTANSHGLFRVLSRLFLVFDRNPLVHPSKSEWGNLLLIAKKPGHG